MFKRGVLGLLLMLGVGMTLCGTGHGAVIEGSLVVTDVTPVMFSVVWGTQEPARGSVSVFFDAEGTKPVTGAVIKPQSPEHPPAEEIGVMKVDVMGLRPDTEYFFRTQTTLKRNNAVHESSLTPVRTEKASVIVRNDVLVQKVDIVGSDPGPGMLVIASLEAASHPITGWMADGVPEGWAAIDTNNFYSKQTRVNLELFGGEVITLKLFAGFLGSAETVETIPAETGGIQKLSRAVSLTVSGGAEGVTGAAGASGGGGGGCFISSIME